MDSAYTPPAHGNSNPGAYLEEKTLSSGPVELVGLLYGKAIQEIRDARRHLAERNIALRSKAISKACDVIGELDGSLNMDEGGEFALRLRGLYRYFLVRLLDANLQQADEPLAEVLGLLATLSEGWQTVARSEPATSPATGGRWDVAAEATHHSHSWTL